MVTNLTIKTYVDGENDVDFTNGKNTNPIEAGEFTYTAQRMGAVPNIVATIYDFECLDSLWNKKQYVEYNSEKYFVYNTPTSYKDNEDGRYKHTVTFLSERHELNGIFFFDVIGGEYTSSFFSNSTEVYFYGDLVEFASRLQASIIASGVNYTVKIDDDVTETEATMVSFEDTYTLDALQEAYALYGVPYYFVGRVIHFGYTDNAITTVLEYGDNLLSVTKTNAAEKVVTYCTGTGSEDNIPYYYPNTSDYASDRLKIPYEIEERLDGTCAELGIGVTNYDAYTQSIGSTSSIIVADKTNLPSQIYTLWTGELPEYSEISINIFINSINKNNHSTKVSGVFYLYNPTSGGLNYFYYTPQQVTDYQLTYTFSTSNNYSGTYQLRFRRPTTSDLSPTYTGYVECDIDAGVVAVENASTYYVFNIDTVVEYIEDTLIPNNPTYSTELNELLEWTIGKIDYYNSPSNAMATSNYLMPSIFRSSGATERFYGAKNNYYLLPDGSGDYYEFENVYEDATIKEQVKIDFEDIKPTIVGITNANGDLIATVTKFAYDENDDDSFETENGEVSTTYAHPYFYAKLKPTDGTYGFNLFESHIDEDPMVLTLTSGSLQGTDFEVQAVPNTSWTNGVEYLTYWNPVYTDDDGNLLAGDYRDKMTLDADKVDKNRALPQQDTRNGEVWIALKKSENNFGVILPNATNSYYPEDESSFVLTHISLPQAYITAAEKRLEDAIIAYMYDNNVAKYNFTIKFSRVYLAEHPKLVAELNENARLSIKYDNKIITSYISTYTYKRSASESLPEITVTLSDTIGVTSGALQNAISEVSATVTGLIPSSADFLKAALPYFLRKDVSDTAQQPLYFSNGAYSSDFRHGFSAGNGWGIYQDNDGNTVGEFDQLIVRQTATFNELVINQISFTLGQTVFTNGGFEVTSVEEDELWYRCYYDNEEGKRYAGIVVGDFVRCQEYDSSYASVTRFYSRLVVAIGDDYVDLSKEVFNGVGAPQIGDNCVQWGNYEDESRQYAIIRNVTGGGYDQFLWGINTVSSVGTEYYFVGQNSAEDPRMQFGNEAIGGIRAVLGKEDDGITPKVDVDIWANSFSVKSPTGEWEDVSEQIAQARADAQEAIDKAAAATELSRTQYWAVSDSSTVTPTGFYETQQQMTSVLKYLWTYVVITYADNSTTGSVSDAYVVGVYGETGATGAQGEKGDKGDTGERGLQGLQGLQGADGADGQDGADGATSYFHIAYADSATGSGFSQSPTGKDYIGTYADFTSSDAGSTSSLWKWQLVKGADGADGSQGIAGTNGADGVTYYLHIAYADDAYGNGFDTADATDKDYIGTYTDTNIDDASAGSSLWKWAKIKGETGATGAQGEKGDKGDTGERGLQGLQGADGADGIAGADGADGQDGADGATSYFHIAYADSATGSGFSQSPTGKDYIGTYADFTSSDAGSTSSLWKWQLVKGADGADGSQGIAGTNGADGVTYYLHIAYADDAYGNGFDTADATDKDYIGTYTDTNIDDASAGSSLWKWAKIKGETGATGVDGTNANPSIYKTSMAQPDAPVSLSYPPDGWGLTPNAEDSETTVTLNISLFIVSETSGYTDYMILLDQNNNAIAGVTTDNTTGVTITLTISSSTTLQVIFSDAPPTTNCYGGFKINSINGGTFSAGDEWSLVDGYYTSPTFSYSYTSPKPSTTITITKNSSPIWNCQGAWDSTGTTVESWGDVVQWSGTSGSSIDTITNSYYLSTSATELLDGEWVDERPEYSDGNNTLYLWFVTTTTYTEGKESTTTNPALDPNWINMQQITADQYLRDTFGNTMFNVDGSVLSNFLAIKNSNGDITSAMQSGDTDSDLPIVAFGMTDTSLEATASTLKANMKSGKHRFYSDGRFVSVDGSFTNGTFASATITDGTIGGFSLANGRVGKAFTDSGETVNIGEDGLSLYDSFIRFKEDDLEVKMGAGLIPPSAGAASNYLLSLTNNKGQSSTGTIQRGIVVSVDGTVAYNVAVQATGAVVSDSLNVGYGLEIIEFSGSNQTIPIEYKAETVLVTNIYSSAHVGLPSRYYVANRLGISHTTPFSVPLKIMGSVNLTRTVYIFGRSSQDNIMDYEYYPYSLSDGGGIITSGIEMGKGNTYRAQLVFDGTDYYAYVNYRNA